MKGNFLTPSEKLYAKLKEHELDFFVSVPCKLLDELIKLIENDSEVISTPVTREEEGIGILTGAYLAGRRPAIILQNSGIGNCINAICSLLNYYRIPLVFITSHRGTEGEPIEAQRQMGNATKALLKAVNVKFFEISTPEELHFLDEGLNKVYAQGSSVAFLFPFSYWK